MKSLSTQYCAQRVLEGGLDAEDQVVLRLAQVEEAPVHALVDAAVGGDRGLGDGRGRDVERRELDLDAAELHALVVLELAGGGDEGALGEAGDGGGGLVGDRPTPSAIGRCAGSRAERRRTRREARRTAPSSGRERSRPSRRRSRGRREGGQVLDQYSCSHEPKPTVRHYRPNGPFERLPTRRSVNSRQSASVDWGAW